MRFGVEPFSLAVAASLVTCAAASGQTMKTFNDWVVACDNTRFCTAVGMGEDGGAGGAIVVKRQGGPGAEAKVTVVVPFEWPQKATARPVEIGFDEPGFESVFPGRLDAGAKDDGSAIALAPRSLDAFLAALRKAKSMDIRRVDGLGKPDESTARVSLAGAVAALLWMDERQGRVRGPDAMIARGTLAVKVPPAPQQPIVTRAKGRATQLRIKPPPSVAQAWKSACEDWEEALPDATAGYLLAPDMALWTFGCTRGAYNFSSMFFLVPRGGAPKLVRFEEPKDGRLAASGEELVNAEFDPQDMTISFFSKGRGIGDCGRTGRYAWDGRAFRLVEYAAMDVCRGMLSDHWPVLWRAQVK